MRSRDDQAVDHFHGIQEEEVECGSDFFPKVPFTACFLPCCAKHRTGDLLNLVDEKGQHHEGDKEHAEEFLAKPIVVFKIAALVFQSIERFIFYFPAGTPSSHDLVGVGAGNLKIGHPAEVFNVITL